MELLFMNFSFLFFFLLECSLDFMLAQSDTVQPCDRTQVRLNSDFGVKSATVQVYGNSYNFQFDSWIELNFYVDSPDMLSYYGLRF
jgi:hypothetical protein